MRVRDLFAGPGGWDLAARSFGGEVDGWEWNHDTRLTRAAAGLKTVGGDVRDCDGSGDYEIELGSPPCPGFSTSGLKVQRARVAQIVEKVRAGIIEDESLVLEPLRVLLRSGARAAAWEQVPSVLPIWEASAELLRAQGWDVATGVVRAEQFGIPQLRERAVLVARRDGRRARLPIPTHRQYLPMSPQNDGESWLRPWVSQGEALGIPNGYVGFPRRNDRPGRGVTLNGVEYRARDLRSVGLPAQTVTEKARSWSVWETYAQPRRFTLAEACTIQTFPVDHPFQGSRSSRFLQCANAVPPVLAQAILSDLVN